MHPPVSVHSGDRPVLFRFECLTILALSRERRESQLAKSGNRSAPLVGLQRRVRRLGLTYARWFSRKQPKGAIARE